MKNILLTITLIAIAFCLPLEVSAKGKPVSAAQLQDANGETVGRVIGMEHINLPFILTDQGYRTSLYFGGVIGLRHTWFNYESTDCTGTPYVWYSKGTVFTPDLLPDEVYELGKIYYIPYDAERVLVSIGSQLEADPFDPICRVVEPPWNDEFFHADRNDPDVTGIKNTIYPAPMVIE